MYVISAKRYTTSIKRIKFLYRFSLNSCWSLFKEACLVDDIQVVETSRNTIIANTSLNTDEISLTLILVNRASLSVAFRINSREALLKKYPF